MSIFLNSKLNSNRMVFGASVKCGVAKFRPINSQIKLLNYSVFLSFRTMLHLGFFLIISKGYK
jgi:hypothetical protein